jgi:hypothetical protein
LTGLIGGFTSIAPRVEDVMCLPEHEAIAKLVKSAGNRKQNRQLSDFFTGSETLALWFLEIALVLVCFDGIAGGIVTRIAARCERLISTPS